MRRVQTQHLQGHRGPSDVSPPAGSALPHWLLEAGMVAHIEQNKVNAIEQIEQAYYILGKMYFGLGLLFGRVLFLMEPQSTYSILFITLL